MTDTRPMIAVGVDGSFEATEAARYAAAEAHARGLSLLLVHAYQLPPRPTTLTEAFVHSTRASAERVVRDVLSQVQVPAGVDVNTVVELTEPVLLLQRVSQRAVLLALGQHGFDLADQWLSGPVTSRVTATARCPVLVVPRRWSRFQRTRRSIAVALDEEVSAPAVLRFAFAEAERRRASLIMLHSVRWRHPQQTSGALTGIEHVLAEYRRAHPEVPVSNALIESEPSRAILDASRKVGLVVTGRPRRHRQWGSWHHSIAQSVLATARCPLAVIPPGDDQIAHLSLPLQPAEGRPLEVVSTRR